MLCDWHDKDDSAQLWFQICPVTKRDPFFLIVCDDGREVMTNAQMAFGQMNLKR